MRTTKKIKIKEASFLKSRLLRWAQQFQEVVWLDSNSAGRPYSRFDAVLAVDAFTAVKTSAIGAFDQLREYQRTTEDWIFGYLSYDLKNDVETLHSGNPDFLAFPDLYFFQPKKLFLFSGEDLEISYLGLVDDEMEADLAEIFEDQEEQTNSFQGVVLKPRLSKQDYLLKVNEMLEHIRRGNIYEANLCQEFYAEDSEIDPLQIYEQLNSISEPPFAAFARLYEHYIISASPERYLQKQGQRIISQPIKGTAPRSTNAAEDEAFARALQIDPKERSENIMIVDLVRNDLSKIAQKASVKVEELCGVYSFKQVHQMVSTVSAQLEAALSPVEALRSTFPMGSMTGAPKVSAMKIIEELEETRRGVYSGSLGYFTPNGDFDFNVVIRSILYNQEKKYLSCSVGGAITAGSDPEKEYNECLLKVRALKQVLEHSRESTALS